MVSEMTKGIVKLIQPHESDSNRGRKVRKCGDTSRRRLMAFLGKKK